MRLLCDSTVLLLLLHVNPGYSVTADPVPGIERSVVSKCKLRVLPLAMLLLPDGYDSVQLSDISEVDIADGVFEWSSVLQVKVQG